MTAQADLIRDRRRAYAAPGGFHDRMVRVLARGLPAVVGVIVAVMMITPLFPRNEVSFLLDRNKVAITSDRLKVSDATYRGEVLETERLAPIEEREEKLNKLEERLAAREARDGNGGGG